MANVNLDLFRRFAPEKKLEIIKAFTESELLSIRESTILRMIKEAGTGDSRKTRCKFKTLSLRGRGAGNHWNSNIESVYNSKKDAIYLSVYIQGDDTDSYAETPIDRLLNRSDYDVDFGSFEESYLHGPSRLIHAMYGKDDRAEVIRAICNAYVHNKYDI